MPNLHDVIYLNSIVGVCAHSLFVVSKFRRRKLERASYNVQRKQTNIHVRIRKTVSYFNQIELKAHLGYRLQRATVGPIHAETNGTRTRIKSRDEHTM